LIKIEYIPPYYQKYLKWVDDENLLALLERDYEETIGFLKKIPASKHDYTYKTGKWTIKQILLHLIDVERVFLYRAHRFSRNDTTDLPGFDQEEYIDQFMIDKVSWDLLYQTWDITRKSTILFYKAIPEAAGNRSGRAMGQEFTPESIGYILAGHTRHHVSIIREKYL
jgi:hypothetical protein